MGFISVKDFKIRIYNQDLGKDVRGADVTGRLFLNISEKQPLPTTATSSTSTVVQYKIHEIGLNCEYRPNYISYLRVDTDYT